MEFHHVSVMLKECIDSLSIRPDGIYVDGTAGGAGHSREIAARLKNGRLIAIDRDPDAVAITKERLSEFSCVTVVQGEFSDIKNVLQKLEISGIDGMLLDLGVSSFQLDTPERGFSYLHDAPLDMRMSKQGLSAYDIVNSYSVEELTRIIREYGEERYAFSIARNIEKQRSREPVKTTFELLDIIKKSMPAAARRDGNPGRRTFQALRIAVNGELEQLSRSLEDAFDCLNPGGRFCIITFHSLEDRMVKTRFADYAKGCICPPDFPVCVCGHKPRGKLISRKAIEPSPEEIEGNLRSRSAKLRVIEKI